MSLLRDFQHYYCGTWIAQRSPDGKNLPLYVLDVRQQGNFDIDDYSHDAEMSLVFEAERWTKNSEGQFERQIVGNIPVFDHSLILESPDVGYLQHGNNTVSWTHINPVRQRAKGLMGNKLRGTPPSLGRSIPGDLVYNLFNPEFEGLVTRFIYINPVDGKVYYKGAYVGNVLLEAGYGDNGRQSLNLLEKFKHISSDLSSYNVELVESL